MSTPECTMFDDHLEELSLGHLDEPLRGRLLAHASACHLCAERLDSMASLTDALLSLTPEHEPPAGFESRVLARLGEPVSARHPARSSRRGWLTAAAVAVALTAGGVAGSSLGDSAAPAAGAVRHSGSIVRIDGSVSGSIRLVDAEHPFALVTIDAPRPGGQQVWCHLEMADGSTTSIGSWTYDDVKANVWAIGIDRALLDAVRMHVVDESGAVIATAELT